MTKLMNFTLNDEDIKTDFNEYITAVGGQSIPQSRIQGFIISYIFERRLPGTKKTVIDIYKEKHADLTNLEREILSAIEGSFSSVFEIRRMFGSGFELYNLTDEITYRVISLSKMNNFRGVSPGQFALCRIFEYQKEYYLTEVSNIISSSNKDRVYKYAIARIVENPECAYKNNPDKKKEIEATIKSFGEKFEECFKTDEIVTTNTCADNIINMFNLYCDGGEKPSEEDISSNIKAPEKNRYFAVSEFKNSYSTFMEKSLEGFSSHNDTYDIGIIYDKKSGLFVLPFYETFCKIYETEDYKNIQGYKDCVKSFLENDKIPASIIKRIAAKYENFTARTNEIFEKNYSFDELLLAYKPESCDKEIFSSTSVLYAAKIFEKMMNAVSEKENFGHKEGIDYSNVGRNDKCPCGSGKKYKHCCMPKQL